VIAATWTLTGIVFMTGFLTAPESFLLERATGTSNAALLAPAASQNRGQIARYLSLSRIFLLSGHLWMWYSLAGILAGLRLSDDFSFVVFIGIYTVPDGFARKFRWMSFLPVSPRAVLAWVLLPALVALTMGYELAVRIPVNQLPLLSGISGADGPRPVPGFREQIMGIMILAAGLMAMTLAWLAGNYRHSGGRAAIRIVSTFAGAVLFLGQRQIAAFLPANLPVAISLGAVPLVLLCWALDALFRRLEFVDKPAAGDPA
jgi:hypothetical protein